ncbi:MAG TPA: penicillin-binding transpeptidase domain-containing protein [Chloroflexia bacterium]|nr:penicillin-binding transpeptidase domain-containing protein [Chloroflexia bacterium]
MARTVRFICGLIAAGAVIFGLLYRPANYEQTRNDDYWLLALLVAGLALLGVFWAGRGGVFKSKRSLPPEERLRHNVQRVSSVIIVAFLLITLQLLREQVIMADEIEKPFNSVNAKGEAVTVQDPRVITEQLANQRGRIFDASGKEVAGISISKYGLVKRTYDPNSPIKQILGYYSPLQFGNSGLEANYDDYLSGKAGSNPFLTLQRKLLNQPTVGNDLYLTIDPKLQQTAANALGSVPGAIVLMDAKSGAVLAMVGYPNYNPADLVFDPTLDDSQWNQETQDIQARWNKLRDDKTNPLLVRPTQGLYTPGSIYKTVTLSGMLEFGKTTPDATWDDKGFLVVNGTRINDPNRPNQNTTWTSKQGYMFSLNAVFAQMGLKLGKDDIINISDKYGFDQKLPFDIFTETSRVQNSDNFLDSQTAQAETGFGQGQLQLTPLNAALIAAAVGRGDGILPKPYMVQQIKTHDGALVKEAQPGTWLQAVRPETAKTMHDIMIASATDGWVGLNGGGLKGSGAVVGGKTGTAELGNNINNAWYIAWASKGDRLFSIAVVVDHKAAGEGLRDAMPRANQVLLQALAGVK